MQQIPNPAAQLIEALPPTDIDQYFDLDFHKYYFQTFKEIAFSNQLTGLEKKKTNKTIYISLGMLIPKQKAQVLMGGRTNWFKGTKQNFFQTFNFNQSFRLMSDKSPRSYTSE